MSEKVKGERNRRKDPRVSVDIEIKIADILFKGDGHFQAGRTKNISCSGMYCNVSRFILPLTKVEGVLKLPLRDKKDSHISFKGVVVRTEPEKEIEGWRNYNIAIFFRDMLGEEKQKIQQYLKLEDLRRLNRR